MKRSQTKRKIIVDGKPYTWQVTSSGGVVVRSKTNKRVFAPHDIFPGMTPDSAERGMWKGWYHVTPKNIESLIRKNFS